MEGQGAARRLYQLRQCYVVLHQGLGSGPLCIGDSVLGLKLHQQKLGCESFPYLLRFFQGQEVGQSRFGRLLLNGYLGKVGVYAGKAFKGQPFL